MPAIAALTSLLVGAGLLSWNCIVCHIQKHQQRKQQRADDKHDAAAAAAAPSSTTPMAKQRTHRRSDSLRGNMELLKRSSFSLAPSLNAHALMDAAAGRLRGGTTDTALASPPSLSPPRGRTRSFFIYEDGDATMAAAAAGGAAAGAAAVEVEELDELLRTPTVGTPVPPLRRSSSGASVWGSADEWVYPAPGGGADDAFSEQSGTWVWAHAPPPSPSPRCSRGFSFDDGDGAGVAAGAYDSYGAAAVAEVAWPPPPSSGGSTSASAADGGGGRDDKLPSFVGPPVALVICTGLPRTWSAQW